MERKKYLPRVIDTNIEEYLKVFGAVCVEGPKWCGKTWTSSFHSNSRILLGDPGGNFQNRKLAELSPTLILEGEAPRLIDEWQEVPSIWDAVRHEVDRSSQKGRFILTGSATPNRKGILHSGAGRIAKIKMRPMSLFESGDSTGKVSLQHLCAGELHSSMTGEVDLKKMAEYIIRGGWPGSLGLTAERAALIPTEYLHAVLEGDIYRVDGIKRNTQKMRLLLRSLARNESTTATNRTLKNDMKEVDDEDVDAETVKEYLDIFDRLFLTDNQPPFSTNVRSSVRVKQAEKRHFVDPSLAASLLQVTKDNLIGDLETFGFLFESLCERDLKIYAESFGAHLYHYQDYQGKEIDAVISLPNGEWVAFEIKLGAHQIDDAADHLLALRENFRKDPNGKPPKVLCVLCGLTNAAYRREDGVFVVPLTALKP